MSTPSSTPIVPNVTGAANNSLVVPTPTTTPTHNVTPTVSANPGTPVGPNANGTIVGGTNVVAVAPAIQTLGAGTGYNGMITRQNLLALAQYVASATFLSLVTWRPGQHDILAVNGPANGPIESVMCVVVGIVSREKAFLGTNGTFNARFSDPLKNARTAKWQLSLEGPRDDIHFGPDWDVGLNHLQTVQGQVARTTDKRHLILPGGKLRMGRNIWEPKNADNTSPNRNAITNNYPIVPESAQWWDLVKETHQINLMPVYDINDQLNTRAETWERELVGALVEATISIRHFYMGVTPSRPDAYDVFSATIESLSILVKPAPILRSPFRQHVSPTKPQAINQSLAHIPQPVFVAAGPSATTVGLSATAIGPTVGSTVVTVGPSATVPSAALPPPPAPPAIITPAQVTAPTTAQPTAGANPDSTPTPSTSTTISTNALASAELTGSANPTTNNTNANNDTNTNTTVPVCAPTTTTTNTTPTPIPTATPTATLTTTPTTTTTTTQNVSETPASGSPESSGMTTRRSNTAGKRRETDNQEEGSSAGSKRSRTD